MKIVCIKDIIRKDVPIYYIRLYTGVAVLDLNSNNHDIPIEFSIETKPTGHKEISVNFIESLDYPLVPIIKELKQNILDLDGSGGLPD
jgi:hypothetical protein